MDKNKKIFAIRFVVEEIGLSLCLPSALAAQTDRRTKVTVLSTPGLGPGVSMFDPPTGGVEHKKENNSHAITTLYLAGAQRG